jgi:hypothetical protein
LATRLTLVDYGGYPVLPTPHSALAALLAEPLDASQARDACQGEGERGREERERARVRGAARLLPL